MDTQDIVVIVVISVVFLWFLYVALKDKSPQQKAADARQKQASTVELTEVEK
jgi:preprotein translocase subunit YajC